MSLKIGAGVVIRLANLALRCTLSFVCVEFSNLFYDSQKRLGRNIPLDLDYLAR